ncbi:MAG: phospho-sugar mutase [Candidatus Magasanikbacteria bacterium]|nr:phospho-sugar mutase [Candidatus Magasanikbacteria bacterium]
MIPENLRSKLSPEAFSTLEVWLTDPEFSQYKEELNNLIAQDNFVELEDRFYKHVEVGTGGIRGTLGAGPNRINLRIVGEAAQGLAEFIKDFGPEAIKKGVVVGHEARKMSEPFAKLCCEVFTANGIKTFLFAGLRATPEISFAVRQLGAVAGVQLTASHNPRTDNGFKFYWEDGGQVVPPQDEKFMQLVKNVRAIKRLDFPDAQANGFVRIVGPEVDELYLNAIKNLSLVKSRSAKIVFSPIHGAGSTNVLPILQQERFAVAVVPEQAEPDENFPTATGDLINPEYPEVMALPIKLGESLGADLAICSDPDADRIGVAAKKSVRANAMQFLTGNEVGVALTAFVLEQLNKQNKLTPNSLVIETYVTSSLISEIAKSYGIKVVDDLLVGFKYIGEIIEKLENKNDFVFAAEESLGYLRGSFVRDKDAAISAFTLAELASVCKDSGQTVVDYLDGIYVTHGYYKNILNMVEMRGRIGFENRDKIMTALRANPPTEFAGWPVLKIIDRLSLEKRAPTKYVCGATGDQITFIFSDDSKTRLTARPSGTEPKIKYYIQHQKKVATSLASTKTEVDAVAKKIEAAILALQEKILNS